MSKGFVPGSSLSQTDMAYIGIGANIGDRLSFCRKAVCSLQTDKALQVTKISSLYETEPVDFLDQDSFYNAVVALETRLSPDLLLQHCQEIEQDLGKKIKRPKGPRTIDLDVLFYHLLITESPQLTLPHPEVENRLFVLIPMLEIAPDFVHPGLSFPIKTLLARLKSGLVAGVEKRFGPGWEKG